MTTPGARRCLVPFLLIAFLVVSISPAFADGVRHRFEYSTAFVDPISKPGVAFNRPVGLKANAAREVLKPLEENAAPSSRRTKAVWTIIGGAVGAGVGMWAGFRAFDQATYAERKITTAMIAGGAIGGVVGWTIGWGRSRGAQQP
jgi:hypothetical protein